MTRFVFTLLVGVFLAGCQTTTAGGPKSIADFRNSPDYILCINFFTYNNARTEAKRRGLSCEANGVVKTASNASI